MQTAPKHGGEWSGQQDLNLRPAVPKPVPIVHKLRQGNAWEAPGAIDAVDSALYLQSKYCRVVSGKRLLKIPRCFPELGGINAIAQAD
jgi:hypothetical protein